ncbi:MAG TPA: acyl-CoA dehydratase activase [Fibrobacteria bacterium]|nr:acyl-CoA dehydratase activase [Fibrobacteria bacterium]
MSASVSNPNLNGSGLGIDIGAASVKVCRIDGSSIAWSEVRPHDGDLPGTLKKILVDRGVEAGIPALITGQEGRRQFRVPDRIAPAAVERAVGKLGETVDAVVSVGGEDLVVYTLDPHNRIVNTYAGNKCASGTGEFFAQQLKRMGLPVEAVFKPEVAASQVCKLSSRCSVFMKSDCTHKLNKGEADKHDIVLSLSNVMSKKVVDFLNRARITKGRVLLAGGATKNPHLVQFLRDELPDVEFLVPEQAAWLEAWGMADMAREEGAPLPAIDDLLGDADIQYPRAPSLELAKDKVRFVEPKRAVARPGRQYVLGIDGGSTTTKVVLLDMETKEIVASHYGRTLGDPVAALRKCMESVREQLSGPLGAGTDIDIRLVATTGSSRELLGVFCETGGVYNEIIAHTVGVTHFDPDIDTIFEIGGQDAKYVHLRNRVPVDYAMNEACSAGTGSFLEESASGDLDIHKPEQIGPAALAAKAPLRFGEHCSAFINSDIRKAIQQGATRDDIVAGLVLSIVSNYLNRVVGNRRVGSHIVLQGGVAKNPAVPMAFATLLGKNIIVPPDPELMGCFGVALLALEKHAAGDLDQGQWSIADILAREVTQGKVYRCKACDNFCPIQMLDVGGHKYHFGGRCNRYANSRRKNTGAEDAIDWVEKRHELYFDKYSAKADELPESATVVAVPEAFSVHTLWPLYSNFFHQLGVRPRLVSKMDEGGVAKCESSYCYPAELAHAVTETARKSDVEWYFLPQFKAMPSYQDDIHACLCPIMQGVPYYLRTALGLDDSKILRPVLDFTKGFDEGSDPMVDVAVRLGFTKAQGRKAWAAALAKQKECYEEGRRIGAEIVAKADESKKPIIVLCGRPYNVLTSQANMGIPRKFATRGYTVIPFDFMPFQDEEITDNMYWYYGQQNLKSAVQVKAHPNLFLCFVSNFSCAPDSFILHYLRWIHNTKPFLILELDSHTADAGVDTRIEAFLDIVEGYRRAKMTEDTMMVERDWDIQLEGKKTCLRNNASGEVVDLTDRRVQMLWPSMGQLGTRLLAGFSEAQGIRSVALPEPDFHTASRARAVASGKECIPSLLVLGSFLDWFANNEIDPERVYVLFMPLTTGPCRTGQYAIFYENLFRELGYKNVLCLSLNSDNSYTELGTDWSKNAMVGIYFSDMIRDIRNSIRALAQDSAAGLAVLDKIEKEAVECSQKGVQGIWKNLPLWADRLAAIPLKKTMDESRKVMVVGEIFVRRDEYSVSPLTNLLSDRGIATKIAGLGEWINYLDWDQVRRYRKSMNALPLWKRPFSVEARKLAWMKLEMAWKHHQETKIEHILSRTGLLPPPSRSMKTIMERSYEFGDPELESEASLSPAVSAIAMEDGWDGIAIISPFACLPGRLIEAVYAPWARDRGLPVIAIENDGNAYPPNVVSRIEIFAHNVSRGLRGEEVAGKPIHLVACEVDATPGAALATKEGEFKPTR